MSITNDVLEQQRYQAEVKKQRDEDALKHEVCIKNLKQAASDTDSLMLELQDLLIRISKDHLVPQDYINASISLMGVMGMNRISKLKEANDMSMVSPA